MPLSGLNVFSGPNSIRDFHDPDKNPFIPLVEIPDHPFTSHGVRIYAKMLNMVPSANVKALPALNMMLRAEEDGSFRPGVDKIVEYSSGNTALSLSIFNRIFGNGETTAYISNKTSQQKLQLLRFFGLEIKLFGGPPQVEPADPVGGINAAIHDGKMQGLWNPGQYSSLSNSEAHERWTGPQLEQQIPDLNVFAAALGTSGTMTGTGTYLRKVNKNLTNLGVFTAPGDRVPGPRPIDLIQSVDLPWKEVIDREEHVNSYDSYAMSLKLCREGILCGPSSGLALKGLYQFLARTLKGEGNLDRLRGAGGEVNCVFICCDYPFQYISEYFMKLDSSNFPKIHREELLEVDKYMYGIDWKLSPADAWSMLKSPCSTEFNITVDLRDKTDYQASRVINSFNLDLQVSKDPNPFLDSATLVRQWNALMTRLDLLTSNMTANIYCSAKFILICYSGYTASIACSILRHRGVTAYYVVGGFEAWHSCNIPMVTALASSADL